MLLDFRLAFQVHWKSLLKKQIKRLFFLRKFQNILPRSALLIIYKCFARTHLNIYKNQYPKYLLDIIPYINVKHQLFKNSYFLSTIIDRKYALETDLDWFKALLTYCWLCDIMKVTLQMFWKTSHVLYKLSLNFFSKFFFSEGNFQPQCSNKMVLIKTRVFCVYSFLEDVSSKEVSYSVFHSWVNV